MVNVTINREAPITPPIKSVTVEMSLELAEALASLTASIGGPHPMERPDVGPHIQANQTLQITIYHGGSMTTRPYTRGGVVLRSELSEIATTVHKALKAIGR